MRVVATCTTLPDRYPYLLRMLKSLHIQSHPLDEIYLTVPYVAKRLNKKYGDIPKDIGKLCTVVRCEEDYGPICKLYGAIFKEHDPDTLIISVDDDTIYDFKLVETLIEKSNLQPDAAVTGTGWLVGNFRFFSMKSSISLLNNLNSIVGMTVPEEGRKIDILVGSAGVLYKRKFFPKTQIYDKFFRLSTLNDDMFKNDDIVISAYLCSKNIDRYVFNNVPITNSDDTTADALSINYMNMLYSFFRTVKYCKEINLFTHFEKLNITDAPTFKVMMIIIFIFLILIICIVINHYQKIDYININ